jgi:transcriptional regulator
MANDARLYAPAAYAAQDPLEIVRQYPFALLVTTGESGILATSTPLFLETDDSRDVLVGHMAGANQHAASLERDQPALAVFAGPHAYISASWYRARPTVPTWNYVAAHVRGRIEPIDEPASQLDVLRRTAAMLEGGNETPWTLEQAPPGRVDFLLPKIRAFRLRIERVEGVTKLSQTHPAGDRLSVIRHLLERRDGNSVEIARLMAQLGGD